MNFGLTRNLLQHRVALLLMALAAALVLALTPNASFAQDAAEAAETDAAETVAAAESAYTPMAPTEGKGMPVPGGFTFQDQYSDNGEFALWMHDAILLPIITIISLFVLALLLWVVVRYRRAKNPTPSKTTHNTFIEVVWTVIPALILAAIAFPSLTLLARQYEVPPADAVTVKITGYQWYWGYEYPDNDIGEFVSNMLPEGEALANGEPPQLAVDNRLVVPVGVPLRMQVTAADVIHSFAVPALWFKIDAVPGRLNERLLTINEPGVYYGQCSELCGARHGYMPIAVEALPKDQWEAWVRTQGGTTGDPAELIAEDAESAEDAAEAGDVQAEAEAEAAEAEVA